MSDEKEIKTEKIKESELEARIAKTTEEKLTDLITEVAVPMLQDQLKEQLPDALKALKPDPEVEEAQKTADKFESGEEFLKALVGFKRKQSADPRLVLMTKQGVQVVKTAGHLEIGEDAQGRHNCPYPSNSGKAKSYRYANPEPSPSWEGVETRRGTPLMGEGIVQATNV